MSDIVLDFSENNSAFNVNVGETTELGITDVKVNNVSVVDNGVANIDLTSYTTKLEPLYPRAGGANN